MGRGASIRLTLKYGLKGLRRTPALDHSKMVHVGIQEQRFLVRPRVGGSKLAHPILRPSARKHRILVGRSIVRYLLSLSLNHY